MVERMRVTYMFLATQSTGQAGFRSRSINYVFSAPLTRYTFKSKNGQSALARQASDSARSVAPDLTPLMRPCASPMSLVTPCHDRATMPVKAAKASAKAEVKRQQLGFLGEGPWAHVKEGDAHHPNGGGGEFFGRDSKLQKNGGVDGQGGIIVDRWMWDPAAQKGSGPPCHAKCDRPEGCDGHEALSDGDCDELMLRDGDWDKDPAKASPAASRRFRERGPRRLPWLPAASPARARAALPPQRRQSRATPSPPRRAIRMARRDAALDAPSSAARAPGVSPR